MSGAVLRFLGSLAGGIKVVHRLPGRLRVGVAGIRPSAALLAPYKAAVEAALLEICGVTGAEANPLTGTLLVTYDTRRLTEAALLDHLEILRRRLLNGEFGEL